MKAKEIVNGGREKGVCLYQRYDSYEGQSRYASLLYRQENISERFPHLLRRAVLCRLYNESGDSEVRDARAHERACSATRIVGT